MATRIQAFWRGRKARRILKVKAIREHYSKYIANVLFGYILTMRRKRVKKQNIINGRQALIIQRVARLYLGRIHLRRQRDHDRALNEQQANAKVAFIKALSGCQIMILHESLRMDIGKKPLNILSGVDCPCLGPVQALFVSVLGNRGKTDPGSLVANRVQMIEALKFLQKIKSAFEDRNSSIKDNLGNSNNYKSSSSKNSKFISSESTLIQSLTLGIIKLPPENRK